MADPVASFTTQDLVDLIGEEVFMALFDDQGTQSLITVKASTQVALIMESAHAYVNSWLVNLGQLPPDNTATVSKLIRHVELRVAQCFAYQRRPEYVRTYGAFPGGPMWTGITEMLDRIQSGVQRIPQTDQAPEFPQPNQGGRGPEQDGPKALVDSDPIDRTTYGDW